MDDMKRDVIIELEKPKNDKLKEKLIKKAKGDSSETNIYDMFYLESDDLSKIKLVCDNMGKIEYEKLIESERKRLSGIKIKIPDEIWTNNMTDEERKYFIIGQKLEFKKLTGKKV